MLRPSPNHGTQRLPNDDDDDDDVAAIISISSAKRRLKTSQSPIEMAVCCLLRVSCGLNIEQNKGE